MVRALITSKGKADQQKGLLLVRELPAPVALELLLLSVQTSTNEFIRSTAAVAIGQLPFSDLDVCTQAVNSMVNILATDEDYSVRAAAAAGMAYATQAPEDCLSALVEALSRALLEDSEWQVQFSCLVSLGNLKQESAIPVLQRWLSSENDLLVQAAVGALGDIGNKSVVPDLLKLMGRNDMMTRQRLAQALGQIRGAREEPALIDALRTLNKDQSFAVREAASDALSCLGCADAAKADSLSEDELIDFEVANLMSGDEGKNAGASASEALRRRLERSFDKEYRHDNNVLHTMPSARGAERAEESEIAHEDSASNGNQLQAEGDGGQELDAAFDDLIDDLKHGEVLEQTMAAIRLRRYDGHRVAKAVLETSALAPEQSSVRLRSLCVGLLARGGELGKIIELLTKDPDQNVRSACCDALADVGGGPEAIEACIQTFRTDSHWLVRVSAAIALGTIGKGSEAAERELIECLKPEDIVETESPQQAVIRRHAVTALGFLGSQRTLPAFARILGLEEADAAIRLRIAGALRGIHSAESAKLVRSLIDDGNDEVSQMAQGTLDSLAQHGFS